MKRCWRACWDIDVEGVPPPPPRKRKHKRVDPVIQEELKLEERYWRRESKSRIELYERLLTGACVPQRFWIYIAHNGINDGLGAWTPDREWIMRDMHTHPNSVTYLVVDGREKANIVRFVAKSWRGQGCVKRGPSGEYVQWTEADSEQEWGEWMARVCLNSF